MTISLVQSDAQSTPQKVPEFAEFWALYPRRTAKAAALKMWRRLLPAEKRAVMAALPHHISYWNGREVAYLPHAATWLNPVDGRRWEDELPKNGATVAAVQKCAGCAAPLVNGWTMYQSRRLCKSCWEAR